MDENTIKKTSRSRRTVIRERLQAGDHPAKIAADLGVAPSTVYRARTSNLVRKGARAGYLSVGAKVTERERAALDRLIDARFARSRGAVLRRLIRMASDFYAPNEPEEAFLNSAERHLSRLGGNFNQIANALSVSVRMTGKADPSADQVKIMRDAASEVEQIRAVLKQMLDNHQVKTTTLRMQLVAEESHNG